MNCLLHSNLLVFWQSHSRVWRKPPLFKPRDQRPLNHSQLSSGWKMRPNLGKGRPLTGAGRSVPIQKPAWQSNRITAAIEFFGIHKYTYAYAVHTQCNWQAIADGVHTPLSTYTDAWRPCSITGPFGSSTILIMSHHPQIYSPGSSLWYRKVKSRPKKRCEVEWIPSVWVSFVMAGAPELLIKSLTATVRALQPLSSCFTPPPSRLCLNHLHTHE